MKKNNQNNNNQNNNNQKLTENFNDWLVLDQNGCLYVDLFFKYQLFDSIYNTISHFKQCMYKVEMEDLRAYLLNYYTSEAKKRIYFRKRTYRNYANFRVKF